MPGVDKEVNALLADFDRISSGTRRARAQRGQRRRGKPTLKVGKITVRPQAEEMTIPGLDLPYEQSPARKTAMMQKQSARDFGMLDPAFEKAERMHEDLGMAPGQFRAPGSKPYFRGVQSGPQGIEGIETPEGYVKIEDLGSYFDMLKEAKKSQWRR